MSYQISELYDWASGNTDLDVIWADQDGDQPDEPYITLKINASPRVGMAEVGRPDDDGTATITQDQRITLSVSAYGSGGTSALMDLRNSLNLVSVGQTLRAAGYPFAQVLSSPQDISDITGTTWQERAYMDLQFRNTVSVTDDVGLIESVSFTGSDAAGYASDVSVTVDED